MHDKIIKRRRHIGCMRNVGREALILLIAVMASGFRAGAVTNPNGLVMDSVHPGADSLFITRMRAAMDSIRRTEHRPTVALVLSGGGAKGAAETGVMKFLEEKEMPVDIICGTSIGGLIGGLTSIGYKAEDIEDLFKTSDWGELLSDRIHPKYYTIHAKRQRDKFIISIPFLYEKGFREEMEHIREGAQKSLLSSLPSGYAYGFNVGNILSSLTVGYQDSLDFDRLPIPFICVAADLVSCKEKNWGSGELKTAMRSTMSIPGLFEPVRTDGMVLVDGGVRNNFPVDIIRAIGADYVIGIDLSDAEPEYEEVNNIVDMGSRFMTMLGTDSFARNKDAPDILIKPDLTGYNMMSFTPEAVDTMLNRGYKAAVAQSAAIDSLKAITGSKAAMDTVLKAKDIRQTPVRVGSIRFDGISEKDGKYLLRRIGLTEGQFVNADILKDAMSKLQATGCFESINYSLPGRQEPFDLVFRCVKSPVHQFGAGVRFDTEEWLSLILNLGFNARKLSGSKFDFTLKLGGNQKFTALYSLDLPDFPTINAKAEIFYAQTDLNSGLKATSYNAAFWSHTESIFLSNMQWTAFDVNAGIRNKFFGMPRGWFTSSFGNSLLTKDIAADFLGLFINGTIYTMDDKYFPHYGAYFTARYSYDFLRAGDSDFRPISVLGSNLRLAIPLGAKFTLEPDLYIRSIWDNNRDQSLAHKNFVGGSIGGRYMEQQIPFIGFQYLYMYGNFTAVANLKFRYNPVRNLYFSALGGYVRSAEYFDFLPEGLRQSTWGAGLQAAYNTIVGPIKLDLIWSDLTNWGYQISIGFDF